MVRNAIVVLFLIVSDIKIHPLLKIEDRAMVFMDSFVFICSDDPMIMDVTMNGQIICVLVKDVMNNGANFCQVIAMAAVLCLIVSVTLMNHWCTGAAAIFTIIAITTASIIVCLCCLFEFDHIMNTRKVADAMD